LARPIVGLIFEHGRFTSFDTAQTASALAAYSIGLAGYAAVRVLAPAFYALDDSRTPMLVSLGSIAVNYVMNAMLVDRLGHVGLALSTSAVALVNFTLLLIFMRRKLGRIEGRHLALSLAKISLASLLMAAAAWAASAGLAAQLSSSGFSLYLAQVVAAIVAALAVFYFACRLLGVEELNDAVDTVGRRFRRRRPV
jgi:putative peptidoglycan lipid II flippase